MLGMSQRPYMYYSYICMNSLDLSPEGRYDYPHLRGEETEAPRG